MGNELDNRLTTEFKENLGKILEQRKAVTNPKRLSIEAGLGETAVRDILQNKSASPKLDTVQKIAKALKVPLYRLMPSLIDQSYDELEALREENRLLREISDLSDQNFTNMHDLRKAAKDRSEKKKK